MSAFDLKHIARLARLHFKDEELRVFESQVAEILAFVDQLKEVNVSGVEPTSHPLALSNVFREDKPNPSIPIEEFLKKSPRSRQIAGGPSAKGRFFEVPKIIEDKA